MTTYEILAKDMLDTGIKNATTAKARDLALRSMYGGVLTEQEAAAVKIWEARTWVPEPRNVKKGEA